MKLSLLISCSDADNPSLCDSWFLHHKMWYNEFLINFISCTLFRRLVLSFHDMDHLYICMELAEGGNLLQYIDRVFQQTDVEEEDSSRILRWSATTLFYACEIAEALEHIHGQGVVHRDLKPESKCNALSSIASFPSSSY